MHCFSIWLGEDFSGKNNAKSRFVFRMFISPEILRDVHSKLLMQLKHGFIKVETLASSLLLFSLPLICDQVLSPLLYIFSATPCTVLYHLSP